MGSHVIGRAWYHVHGISGYVAEDAPVREAYRQIAFRIPVPRTPTAAAALLHIFEQQTLVLNTVPLPPLAKNDRFILIS